MIDYVYKIIYNAGHLTLRFNMPSKWNRAALRESLGCADDRDNLFMAVYSVLIADPNFNNLYQAGLIKFPNYQSRVHFSLFVKDSERYPKADSELVAKVLAKRARRERSEHAESAHSEHLNPPVSISAPVPKPVPNPVPKPIPTPVPSAHTHIYHSSVFINVSHLNPESVFTSVPTPRSIFDLVPKAQGIKRFLEVEDDFSNSKKARAD